MTSAADQLHPALVHHIVNSLGWPRLRPLQEQAVDPLLRGDHALLVAPTAGDKTEAACFPLLSRMLSEQWQGVTVLYLCPLRALLNDLYVRLDGYARLLGRTVGVWHGDITNSARQRMLRERPDILLTTPESLEAMLLSTRVERQRWFGDVRVAVIDEAHAFGADDRGWHLLAVLQRIERLAGREIQRVALSATVGNPTDLLQWFTRTSTRPRVVVQPAAEAAVRAEVTLDHVGSLENAATVISRLHRGEKRLVFVDSRARAEQLTAELRSRSVNTFVSHGSLGRDERLRSEEAFASERDAVIVATSALELGIDVGDLDRVLQIDAPSTVASFLQRLGRTGRRTGSLRNALFLTTRDDALLRAAGLLLRWSEGYVEPVVAPPLPLHLVSQQLLSLVLQEGHVGRSTWPEWLGAPFVLGSDVAAVAPAVVDHLIAQQYLVDDHGMLGVGPRAESELGRRHFMELTSVFTAPPVFSVRHGRVEVGSVPESTLQLPTDGRPRSLLLGGRSWRVNHVDWRRRIAHVEPVDAPGARTRWDGSGAPMSASIARAVRQVLAGMEPEGVIQSRRAADALARLRGEYTWAKDGATTVTTDDRGRLMWWTFAGDVGNHWLAGSLAGLRRTATAVTPFAIRLDDGLPLTDAREAIADIRPDELTLGGTVATDAIEALKFSDLLPGSLAAAVVAARLDRRSDAVEALGEPVNAAET